MSGRPLHATLLPTGRRMFDLLAEALMGTGPAILPLDPNLSAAHLRRAIDTLRPTALVRPEGTNRIDGGGLPVDDPVALVIATSGSTGEPKAVELTADALLHSARAGLARLDARPGDRWLCCLPTHHIGGLQVLVRAIAAGTEPVLQRRFEVTSALRSGAAFVSLIPTMLRRMLDAGADVSAFRTILLGGAAASPALLTEARAVGGTVVTSYGMSETSGGCVYNGVPLDEVEVAVDTDGRIRLRGPVLFAGYRLRRDLTAATTDGSWLVTQDLGRIDDGQLHVLGRIDDVINTGGEKVVAGTIADLLADHAAVREAVVFGRSDPHWGERVCAAIVPADPDYPPSLAQLRDHVAKYAAPYCAPRELAVIDSLPLLPSGKPDRDVLRHVERG